MQKLGFSYSGCEQTAIALFDNNITNDDAIEILKSWIEALEQSDADVWPQ